MRFFCAGSQVSAVNGHISPIISTARIWNGLIAIGSPNNAFIARLGKTTKSSPPFEVIQETIVFFRFSKMILPSLIA